MTSSDPFEEFARDLVAWDNAEIIKQDRRRLQGRALRKAIQAALLAGDRETADGLTQIVVEMMRREREA